MSELAKLIKIKQNCDKCGRDVAPLNNAAFLEYLATPDISKFIPLGGADLQRLETRLKEGKSRHLFETKLEDGKVCPGSSRGKSINDANDLLHIEYHSAFETLKTLAL